MALAHELDMDVIAERVETEQQLSILQALKCGRGHGYHSFKPSDSTAAEVLIVGELEAFGRLDRAGGGLAAGKHPNHAEFQNQ